MNPKMKELLDKRAEIDAQISALGIELLANTSDTLDERWATWKEIANSGALKRETWVCHSNDILGLEWYDDFYYERRQDVDYVDVAELIEEGMECGNWDARTPTQEQYDAWREWVIKNNKAGFTYDW